MRLNVTASGNEPPITKPTAKNGQQLRPILASIHLTGEIVTLDSAVDETQNSFRSHIDFVQYYIIIGKQQSLLRQGIILSQTFSGKRNCILMFTSLLNRTSIKRIYHMTSRLGVN